MHAEVVEQGGLVHRAARVLPRQGVVADQHQERPNPGPSPPLPAQVAVDLVLEVEGEDLVLVLEGAPQVGHPAMEDVVLRGAPLEGEARAGVPVRADPLLEGREGDLHGSHEAGRPPRAFVEPVDQGQLGIHGLASDLLLGIVGHLAVLDDGGGDPVPCDGVPPDLPESDPVDVLDQPVQASPSGAQPAQGQGQVRVRRQPAAELEFRPLVLSVEVEEHRLVRVGLGELLRGGPVHRDPAPVVILEGVPDRVRELEGVRAHHLE